MKYALYYPCAPGGTASNPKASHGIGFEVEKSVVRVHLNAWSTDKKWFRIPIGEFPLLIPSPYYGCFSSGGEAEFTVSDARKFWGLMRDCGMHWVGE